MTHTPGPWKFSTTHPLSGDAWFVVTDNNGSGPIMDVGGQDKNGQIAEAKYLITNPQEIEANARLIAAAPEMLEALERAEWWLSTVEDSDSIRKILQDAITKAKGK